jgi:hypothetical protein
MVYWSTWCITHTTVWVTILTKIGFWFEMNSYSTQVAQLQFEYTHELDKICE